jgi:hypothetical protein
MTRALPIEVLEEALGYSLDRRPCEADGFTLETDEAQVRENACLTGMRLINGRPG